MLNAEIMFVALFGTANYFARLANYFLPFQALAIPWLLRQLRYKERQKITMLAVIGYLLFFVYSHGISESFDIYYRRVEFWTYIKSIWGV